jgi:DNA-binding transcriptional MerR regulator
VGLISIGEFARRSRRSPRRYYAESQLDLARLIAALRQPQLSLVEVKSIVSLELAAAAERISNHGNVVEAQHAAPRDLARYLVDRMRGKRRVMYEVATRKIPARSVLCLKRNVQERTERGGSAGNSSRSSASTSSR